LSGAELLGLSKELPLDALVLTRCFLNLFIYLKKLERKYAITNVFDFLVDHGSIDYIVVVDDDVSCCCCNGECSNEESGKCRDSWQYYR
jgi:hypothetical protein